MDTTSTADTIAGAMVEEGMVAAVTVEEADTTIEEGEETTIATLLPTKLRIEQINMATNLNYTKECTQDALPFLFTHQKGF